VVLVAFLQGMVARVVHGEKRRTSAVVRKRKKWWLFQVWGWSACGGASYLWWSWWWLWLVAGTAGRERVGKKLQKRGRKAGFLPTLDPISFFLRP